MLKGFFNIPQPVNEPVLNYAPGSAERITLKKAIEDARAKPAEIPMYIGGKEVRTGDVRQICPPHNHKYVLATYYYGNKSHVTDAISAALTAKAC